MKPTSLFLALAISTCFPSAFSQSDKVASAKYRRSSIYTIMIDDAGLPKADTIKAAFLVSPVPDKYNDHNLSFKILNPREIQLTDEERKSKGPNAGSTFGKSIVSSTTGGLADTTDVKDLPTKIEKFFVQNQIAKGMVAKWFNRSEKGTFDMQLIGDRGMWDATEMKASVASKSTRGLAMLADAGEELIGNTFVVVTRFKYVNKEEVAKAAKNVLALGERYGGATVSMISKTASVGATVAAKGYVVQTTSYLYKLNWNDSVAAVFYQSYWIDDNNFDANKKAAFDTTSLFKLELIGTESAWADVQSSIFSNKSDEELVSIATVNAIDAVIAKLQKKYDVFKTKTPIYTAEPLTAKIGLKESLEKGDKFEVLEQELDPATNRTKYVRKGTIKVDAPIWDNRYMAGVAAPADTTVDRTYFSGASKKYYEGMLIRQIK